VAAAGKKNGVKYNTKTKRAIRMRMASLMIKPIKSFKELTDYELQGMLVACTADVDAIAQWLAGQEFSGAAIEPRVCDPNFDPQVGDEGWGPHDSW
jgi:hypothetical protein